MDIPEQYEPFRDFGIIPHGIAPPPQTVRADFSPGHVIGQYLGTCLLSASRIGMGLLLGRRYSFPMNVLAAAATLVGFGYIVYRATRNDYAWVELDGETLRARHLYTGRVVERPIGEIEDLLTQVFLVRTALTHITDAWLGRVRGIMIRFRDRRTPLLVSRTDPAMQNAMELIEAIVYRMSQKGEIDAEVILFEGRPLVRRIFRKDLG